MPEAGFPLDTFPVSGLPRKPSAAQIRAAWRASAAPAHCLRILARRRPDVVLGAGGYVAGPMVLAARLRGIPAALTEADAHLGLANRLAAPFAQRLFLAYEIPGRNGDEGASRRAADSRRAPRGSREGREARFGLPPTGPVVAVFGALAGARSLNEMAVEAWGSRGPRGPPSVCGERDFGRVTSRVARDGYVLLAQTDDFGEALRRPTSPSRVRAGTVWELAAAGTPAILVPYPYATADHQTLNARHFERGGGGDRRPGRGGRPRPGARRRAAAPTRRGSRRCAESMLALARPDAADVIADELVALAAGREVSCGESPRSRSTGRRLYFVGIGGSGLSAYANIARAWGAEVRGWDAQETIFTETLEGDRGRPRRRAALRPRASRRSSRRRTSPGATGTPRAAFLAELVAARPSIVVTGAHGKTTTTAMIAYALRETGNDPAWIVGGVVPQLGGNAGTGSGWLVVEGDESDRSAFALRPRLAVVTNVELDHHAAYGSTAELEETIDAWLAGRCRRSCAGGSSSPSTSRSPFPASTTGGTPPRRSRRSSASGVDRAEARGGPLAVRRAPTGASSSSASAAASRWSTTTATTRPSSARRSRRARAQTDRRLVAHLRPARRRADAPSPPRARRGARARRRRDRDRLRRAARRTARRRHRAARPRRGPGPDAARSGRRRSTTPRSLALRARPARRRGRDARRGGAVARGARDRGRPPRGLPEGMSPCEIETGLSVVQVDDDRNRRAGGCVRAAGVARRAGGGARVGGRARPAGRRGRARLEPARRGRRASTRSSSASRATSRPSRSTASFCARAAARRTPSASTARGRRASAASSSPARSPARRAAACG